MDESQASIVIAEWPMHSPSDPFTVAEARESLDRTLSDFLADGADLDWEEFAAASFRLLSETAPDIYRYTPKDGYELVVAACGSPGFEALRWLVSEGFIDGRMM